MNQSYSPTPITSEADLNALKERVQKLEQLLVEIEGRNQRVDLNKKWETSLTRFIGVAIEQHGPQSNFALEKIGNDPH